MAARVCLAERLLSFDGPDFFLVLWKLFGGKDCNFN